MSRLFDDASSQYLNVATAAVTTTPCTLACWFYADDANSNNYLLAVGDGADFDYDLFAIRAVGGVDDFIWATALAVGIGDQAKSTATYAANAWNHACGVFTSSTDRAAFLNGANKGTNATSVAPTGIVLTRIGASPVTSGGSPFQLMSGRIAEAAIWNVALTDAEVAALARGVSPLRIRRASLQGYWPVYGTGSPEPDYSGTALHMTLTGTPAVADHAPVMPSWGLDLGWVGAFTAAAPGGATWPGWYQSRGGWF